MATATPMVPSAVRHQARSVRSWARTVRLLASEKWVPLVPERESSPSSPVAPDSGRFGGGQHV